MSPLGRFSFAFNPQLFKVAHLRNLYQKVGMFGIAPLLLGEGGDLPTPVDRTGGAGGGRPWIKHSSWVW